MEECGVESLEEEKETMNEQFVYEAAFQKVQIKAIVCHGRLVPEYQ